MKQTRLMSLAESVSNVAVGFGLAMITQALVFPVFGFEASAGEHLALAGIFSVISILRSFALRRLFEAIRMRGA